MNSRFSLFRMWGRPPLHLFMCMYGGVIRVWKRGISDAYAHETKLVLEKKNTAGILSDIQVHFWDHVTCRFAARAVFSIALYSPILLFPHWYSSYKYRYKSIHPKFDWTHLKEDNYGLFIMISTV